MTMFRAKQTRAAMRDAVYRYAMELIEEGGYDICEDGNLSPYDFGNAASDIFSNLLVANTERTRFKFRDDALDIFTLGLSWKIKNHGPSYVSCSNENSTGVSRSNASIFTRFFVPGKDEVKGLLDMMNEAWFLMN